jgi:uncharacterized LabA/DUF88 family protein
MNETVFVYVDGESHYIRAENRAKNLWGCTSLEQVERQITSGPASGTLSVREKGHVFWDTHFINPHPRPARMYYFTSYGGSPKDEDELRDYLRALDFEPEVVKEVKDDSGSRANRLRDGNVIEKPKGVDIALTVRMMEDAQQNCFTTAHLFTTDSDFLPLIRAVKSRGKTVIVHGFEDEVKTATTSNTPEDFVDLGWYFRHAYQKR